MVVKQRTIKRTRCLLALVMATGAKWSTVVLSLAKKILKNTIYSPLLFQESDFPL
jgi:hypothetical protein